jgi:hypothetical protein
MQGEGKLYGDVFEEGDGVVGYCFDSIIVVSSFTKSLTTGISGIMVSASRLGL